MRANDKFDTSNFNEVDVSPGTWLFQQSWPSAVLDILFICLRLPYDGNCTLYGQTLYACARLLRSGRWKGACANQRAPFCKFSLYTGCLKGIWLNFKYRIKAMQKPIVNTRNLIWEIIPLWDKICGSYLNRVFFISFSTSVRAGFQE